MRFRSRRGLFFSRIGMIEKRALRKDIFLFGLEELFLVHVSTRNKCEVWVEPYIISLNVNPSKSAPCTCPQWGKMSALTISSRSHEIWPKSKLGSRRCHQKHFNACFHWGEGVKWFLSHARHNTMATLTKICCFRPYGISLESHFGLLHAHPNTTMFKNHEFLDILKDNFERR